MKEIKQELPIGKSHQGIDLYATVQVDDEEPQRFKCESFLGAFVRELYGMMTGGKFNRPVLNGSHSIGGNNINGPNLENEISNVNINGSNEVSVATGSNFGIFDNGNNYNEANPTKVWIWGVRGVPEANGTHHIENIDGDSAFLVDKDGNRVTTAGAYTSGGYILTYQNYPYRHDSVERAALNFWRVIVGTGTEPVKASDIGLSSRVQHGSAAGQLVPGNATSFSIQTTDKPSTRMTLTRSFTNNSGADISINEIGVITSYNNLESPHDYTQFLIVRDVLAAAKNIPNGSTLTVDYEIVFELSPDTQDTDTDGTNGGFLQKFLELLRLNLINADEEERRGYFGMGLSGGISNPTDNDNLIGWQYGLRVGTDNKFTSMTDADLISAVPHGENDGELYHYGTNFDAPVIDDQANEAQFVVKRIFENRGTTPVTLAEMGIYGNDMKVGSNDPVEYTSTPKLLARTALGPADQITVQPGEFLLAEYIIKAVI